jgi:hypothetical protein
VLLRFLLRRLGRKFCAAAIAQQLASRLKVIFRYTFLVSFVLSKGLAGDKMKEDDDDDYPSSWNQRRVKTLLFCYGLPALLIAFVILVAYYIFQQSGAF